jgi:hypothetical protein
MTQAEKLKALARKAVENGWDGVADSTPGALVFFQIGEIDILARSEEQIIFNHGFARALFGEEYIDIKSGANNKDKVVPAPQGMSDEELKVYYWKTFEYHLQQAVISKDPVQYFYEQVFPNE